jgi:hypothetical protein
MNNPGSPELITKLVNNSNLHIYYALEPEKVVGRVKKY